MVKADGPAPEFMDQMLKIVSSTIARRESLIFREPVDWKALGLTDYIQIVKTPMDLGTVKKNIEKNVYKDIEECANDVRLVWTNCMLYNRDGSEYYHLADKFSKAFEDAYGALRRLHVTDDEDPHKTPTVEARIQLSHDIFKIDNVEMARVLTIIEEDCPSALVRKVDEVMINFDALASETFNKVNKFVLNVMVHHGGLNKKRKLSGAAGAAAAKAQKR
uniref:Predicted protein n=1 Tax=uncultured organism MedDCM-OCT-S04-C2 TaxID=743613 RepID=D6PJ37_9ZZZZ|nr:predicted protein [uncultured organism MedDCM-OCT-S04-C2]